MAKLFFGMNQSLDGYVDHTRVGSPSPKLFRHFVEQTDALAGSLYGRTLYGLMTYWDEDQQGWDADHRAFAAAWRKSPKWIVSSTLQAVGPNATLLRGDLETEVRRLKTEIEGEIEIGGPKLARTLTQLGLIDEYRIYLHPEVLGHGTPFFAEARPPLRLASYEQIDDNVLRLSYTPV
ncbi:dihydrofolate reductase family protein [Devosia sp. FJ2-5-3]|jgi:dihydrofolate reductase|uniref:dihydrofolate reductase family protein n=1 Tax=Devosia sp. FJ2-5-3 TaxID=2976680 RepID=UPI0023D8977E|nr:dihydrofolate reductase family protein [Devosia sp. FJ2-5-3]WEJ59606.1 dihydrofolate reductase family protein [Devosia sp. FJ2-5-3]